MKYYSRPETIEKLLSSGGEKVLLVGGFTGFLNFGDVVQLQGAIRWHRERNHNVLLCPLIHPLSVIKGVDLSLLTGLFGTSEWICFTYPSDDPGHLNNMTNLDLESLSLDEIPDPVGIHFYGSGRLNRFWGRRTLDLLDDILATVRRDYYLISGQQVSADFIESFMAHILDHQPDLIGCRDRESLQSMDNRDVLAHYSGDDSLEVLLSMSGEGDDGSWVRDSWGLNYRVSVFTGNLRDMDIEPSRGSPSGGEKKPFISTLQFPSPTHFLETFGFPEMQGVEIELHPAIKGRYPSIVRLNIVEAMSAKVISEVIRQIRGLQFAVVMSYHLALLLIVLGTPVYLVSYNEYYRQKSASIGQGECSLDSFISSRDRSNWLKRQNQWLAKAKKERQSWINQLSNTVGG